MFNESLTGKITVQQKFYFISLDSFIYLFKYGEI